MINISVRKEIWSRPMNPGFQQRNEITLGHVLSEKTMSEASANLSFRSQMVEQEGASR